MTASRSCPRVDRQTRPVALRARDGSWTFALAFTADGATIARLDLTAGTRLSGDSPTAAAALLTRLFTALVRRDFGG